jgi:hypothetical protein
MQSLRADALCILTGTPSTRVLVARRYGQPKRKPVAIVDEQRVAAAARNIGSLVFKLYGQGNERIARAIAEELKQIQKEVQRAPESTSRCRKCGGAVPVVQFGRPRYYCMECHPPRYKVVNKVHDLAKVET